MTTTSTRFFIATAAAACLVLTGCSDNDDSSGSAADETPNDTDPAAGTGQDAGPLWIYGTDVFNPDSTSGFLGAVTALDGQPADLSLALEVPGGGMRFDVVPGTSSIVVRDRERLGLRKYDIGDDGSFTESGFVSFQGVGVTNVNGPMFTVDATRMIYFGFDGFLVEWNPTQMTITGTIPYLDDTPDPSAVLSFHDVAESADGKLIVFKTWLDETFEIEYGTDIVEYDLASQVFTRTERTTDCASFIGTLPQEPAADGFFYYATVANNAGKVLAFEDFPTRPCVRRRSPGSSTFDPGFVRFLDEGGTVFGGLFPINDQLMITQELDASLLSGEPDFDTLNVEPIWRWRSVTDPATFTVTDLGLEPASAQFDSFTLDGITYLHDFDNADTRLLDLSSGTPQVVFQTPGYVRGFARLR